MNPMAAKFARLMLAGAFIVATAGAHAQGWPSRPIRLMVPFAPGGGADVLARVLAPRLSSSLGQPVVVENRPASGGVVAAMELARAAPDGYTITIGGSWLVVGSLLYRNLSYHPERDFTPVSMFADSDVQLYVQASVPATSLREFIDYAKANPGKLNYGSAGIGHPFHLAMEMFKSRAGIDLVHVPYKGMGPAIQDFIAGRLESMFYLATAQMGELAKAGKIRPLAITSSKRNPAFPEVPTFAELGMADFKPAANFSLIGPAGMPRTIVERLHRELAAASLQPEVVATYDKLQFVRTDLGPDEYAAVLRNELAVWAPLVKSLSIALD